MKRKDICKKYLAHNDSVRIVVCDITQIVKDIRKIHNLSNTLTVALGRTLGITCIMSSMLDSKSDRLSIQISGDGPAGNIITCGNYDLDLKGYVTNPEVELKNVNGSYNVKSAIGKGILTVIKDIGLKEPYIGKCNLISSEIAEDFAYYYLTSEQTPSVVSVGVLIGEDNKVKCAGGYIIQPLPECKDEVIDKLESINVKLPSMTSLMSEGQTIDDIAINSTGDKDIETVFEADAKLKCDCSSKRIEATIIALGKEDAINICKENNGIELCCNFCNKKYNYTLEEVEKLFK